jgi:hypothetical protein
MVPLNVSNVVRQVDELIHERWLQAKKKYSFFLTMA